MHQQHKYYSHYRFDYFFFFFVPHVDRCTWFVFQAYELIKQISLMLYHFASVGRFKSLFWRLECFDVVFADKIEFDNILLSVLCAPNKSIHLPHYVWIKRSKNTKKKKQQKNDERKKKRSNSLYEFAQAMLLLLCFFIIPFELFKGNILKRIQLAL